jgi:hypothetical protein
MENLMPQMAGGELWTEYIPLFQQGGGNEYVGASGAHLTATEGSSPTCRVNFYSPLTVEMIMFCTVSGYLVPST